MDKLTTIEKVLTGLFSLGLIGGAVSYGQLINRVDSLEKEVERLSAPASVKGDLCKPLVDEMAIALRSDEPLAVKGIEQQMTQLGCYTAAMTAPATDAPGGDEPSAYVTAPAPSSTD